MGLFGLSIGKKGFNWLMINIFLILFFASMYFFADMATKNSKYIEEKFGEISEKELIDYIYFSLSTQTTVGMLDVDRFGYSSHVTPKFKSNKLTRYISVVQLLSVLIIISVFEYKNYSKN